MEILKVLSLLIFENPENWSLACENQLLLYRNKPLYKVYRDRHNMIQNERQYRITKTKLKEFQSSVAELKKLDPPITVNEKLSYQADIDSLGSFIEEFEEEIAEYESLQRGTVEQLILESFNELPQALIKARIVRGLTQEKLAELLHVKPQQVQRDEANLYAGASFTKLLEVQKALNLAIKQEVIFQ